MFLVSNVFYCCRRRNTCSSIHTFFVNYLMSRNLCEFFSVLVCVASWIETSLSRKLGHWSHNAVVHALLHCLLLHTLRLCRFAPTLRALSCILFGVSLPSSVCQSPRRENAKECHPCLPGAMPMLCINAHCIVKTRSFAHH